MKITPQANKNIKRVSIAVIFFSASLFGGAAVARADGILTPAEERFGDEIADSLCQYIDNAGVNVASMTEAMTIIYDNTPAHMGMDDAVDIINYAVQNYCPSNWDELVAFGEGFRGGSYA